MIERNHLEKMKKRRIIPMNKIKIFGESIIDPKAISQLANCMGEGDLGVMTADGHVGYSHPIGGAIAYRSHISVSGVGFDIACGNKAVRTNIKLEDLKKDLPLIMDEVFSRVSFGTGRNNNEPLDHEIFEKIFHAEFKPQRALYQLAKNQLGTVGSGNHFIDLFVDSDGWIWIGVHFGSRGFGHKTATGFIALSQGLEFEGKGKEGSMESKPILLDANSPLGADYIAAMGLAGEYAYAGRDVVVNKVLEILGSPEVTFSVHNHHNFAWRENHGGEDYWVVRKGCTPAFPGQFGFIGANMKDRSVIVEGIDSDESRGGLYSTVHGAGRILSRAEAAGKKKWIANDRGKKVPTLISKGRVDFDRVQKEMRDLKIELLGAGPDEAPECYKNLKEVLAYQGETIRVVHELTPIGVCMAGNEVYDPYKD